MKKIIFMVLFCGLCFNAAAQTGAAAVFYVSPVSGTGSTGDDNEFIFNLALNEIRMKGYSIAKEERKADYLLTGVLAPYDDINWHFELMFVLTLSLEDTSTGIIMVEQDVIYASLEDLQDIFPNLMQSVLADLPVITFGAVEAPWRNKWLYLGINAYWTPRTYSGTQDSIYLVNFGGALNAGIHFFNFLSLETGFGITTDWLNVFASTQERDIIFEIPLLVKGVFKPLSHFMLEPYTGVQLNLSLQRKIIPSLFSWVIGFQYGVNFGPGIFNIDASFAIDFNETTLGAYSDHSYRRQIVKVGIGYKLGFFTKRN